MADTIASTSRARLTSAPARVHPLLRNAAVAIAATIAIAICAHISLPLPWTPVPLVAQDLAVLTIGFLLGPQLGFLTLVLYLAEGAAGLPMFNPHGAGGVAQLIGPTGGFLLAYPAVAAITGALRSRTGNFARNLTVAALATIVLFLGGAAYFAALLHTSAALTLHSAVTPFLPGSVLKCTLAAGIATWSSTRHKRAE